jgi:hypothetical protein
VQIIHLEAIGLLLPFLCCPNILIGREVTLLKDNEALVFGWDKRRVPHDNSASIFLRATHIISAFLGAPVEFRHLPRMSTPSAELTDALTKSTITQACHRDKPAAIPTILTNLFQNPQEYWNLPVSLLGYVQSSFFLNEQSINQFLTHIRLQNLYLNKNQYLYQNSAYIRTFLVQPTSSI